MPSFIESFLKENMFKLIELIQKNERKDTYILKLKKDNNLFLLKACSDKSPLDIKEKFQVEMDFYLKYQNIGIIPKIIYNKTNLIIFEYFESITLREYLIVSQNDTTFKIEPIINAIKNFSTQIHKTEQKNNTINFTNVYRYIGTLSNSHPMQAKGIKISVLDKILNKFISKLLVYKTTKLLRSFNSANLTNGFSHNDFHYNNILINKDLDVKFIDFENIKYEGYFEFDIIYLIVLMEAYKDNNTTIQEYLNTLVKKNGILLDIYFIYKHAISINEKFFVGSENNSLNKLQKLKLLIQLIVFKKVY